MTNETTKKAASLFLHCQKLINNPKRLRYSDLEPFLSSYVNQQELTDVVSTVMNSESNFLIREKHKHPRALLIEIKVLAEKIKSYLNPGEKLVFITIILKLIKFNNEESNQYLNNAFYRIAEIFAYDYDQTTSIKRLLNQELPSVTDYADSILITNKQPDYNQVIDGFKVIYAPGFNFSMWIKNVKSVNNMLVKIIEVKSPETTYNNMLGNVMTITREVKSLLEFNQVSLDAICSKITSGSDVLPRIEIAATEKSPRVVMNGLENRIEIEGISMTGEPDNFFKPVFHWLEKAKNTKLSKISFHINLAFFNAHSSRILLKLIQKVIELEKTGCMAKLYWHHEEDDIEIKNAGEHYASIVNKEFIFVSSEQSTLISA